ncbi:hypothetical protein CK203_030189 [Vitis vinifera]|uniref:Uncharacterized protein n=1 Tax=Vitis vinifera TaxID=29760 RepID=A0A438I5B2_VITVI|nr:hypothetical protein CK203_030189 [Vitis vinifera]
MEAPRTRCIMVAMLRYATNENVKMSCVQRMQNGGDRKCVNGAQMIVSIVDGRVIITVWAAGRVGIQESYSKHIANLTKPSATGCRPIWSRREPLGDFRPLGNFLNVSASEFFPFSSPLLHSPYCSNNYYLLLIASLFTFAGLLAYGNCDVKKGKPVVGTFLASRISMSAKKDVVSTNMASKGKKGGQTVAGDGAPTSAEKDSPNSIFFSNEQFNMGLHLPLPSLFKQFLHYTKIPLAFIHLNVVRVLMGCSILNMLFHLDLSLLKSYNIPIISRSLPKVLVFWEHHLLKDLPFYEVAHEANAKAHQDHLEQREKKRQEGKLRQALAPTPVPTSSSVSTSLASASMASTVLDLEADLDLPGVKPDTKVELVVPRIIHEPEREDDMAKNLRAGFRERQRKCLSEYITVATPPTKRSCTEAP